MGIQITTHIEFERKAREDEFAPTDTTTIPVDHSEDDEFKVKAPAESFEAKPASPSAPKSPSLLKPAAKEAPAGFDDMDDDIPF
jgi:hypothetical protein